MAFSVIRLGFEPKTHSLEGCCSIQLSYRTDPLCSFFRWGLWPWCGNRTAKISKIILIARLFFICYDFSCDFDAGYEAEAYQGDDDCAADVEAAGQFGLGYCFRVVPWPDLHKAADYEACVDDECLLMPA